MAGSGALLSLLCVQFFPAVDTDHRRPGARPQHNCPLLMCEGVGGQPSSG